MVNRRLSLKKWVLLALFCFLLGVLAWMPNLLFNYGYGYWMLTFVVNPLGIVFGVIGRNKVAIILNAVMTFSFFIFMFVGYLINALFG